MQSAELRELTASEELTLEQEYAMQRELLNQPTHVPLIKPVAQRDMEVNRKLAAGRGQCVALLIALILAPSWFFYWRSAELTFIVLARLLEPTPSGLELTNDDIRALPMIGDVNLFFKNPREDPEFEVECEVMIAGPSLRHSSPSPQTHPLPFQNPRTAVKGAPALLSSCFCLTRATSSA
jgi:hypothetical protein